MDYNNDFRKIKIQNVYKTNLLKYTHYSHIKTIYSIFDILFIKIYRKVF